MERTRRRQTTAAEKMAAMATDNDRSNNWSYRFVFVPRFGRERQVPWPVLMIGCTCMEHRSADAGVENIT